MMAKQAQVEIRGLKRLERKYNKLGKDLSKAMKDIAHKGALYAHSQIPPYPPARPASKYRRTGTLGRKITTRAEKKDGRSYAGILGTNTTYAPWVISEKKGRNQAGPQAWFHKGRWWTLQKVVRDNTKGIVDAMRQEVKALIRRAK